MPKAAVSQSLIRNLCTVATQYEFASDRARARRAHHVTQSTGQVIAKLAQSNNGTDTVYHEVC